MTAPTGGEEGAQDLDALRRRVYSADASADDVERYRRALAAEAAPEQEAPPGQRPDPAGPPTAAPTAAPTTAPTTEQGARPARRRSRRPVVATAVVIAVAGTVLALIPRDRPAGSAPVPLSVPTSVRADFADALDRGRIADISAYFTAHSDRLPPALRTLQRADTEQYSGTGPGAIELNPSALADRGGRVTVVLVVAADAEARWTTSRAVLDVADGRVRRERLATSSGRYRAGLPASATAPYRGQGPDRLAVDLPAGLRWGAAVVLSD